MVVIVIGTGNHYVLDCAGSLVLLTISYLLARGINRVRRWMWPEDRHVKHELPAALGLCIGCARTLDEIARWPQMTDAERERVMAELPRRNSGATAPESGSEPY